MHLANGALTPECAVLTTGLAAAGLTASYLALFRNRPSTHKLQQAAAIGCVVFAAQAVNIPLGATSSAHLLGGVLAAWLLGPPLAILTMSLVLGLQALALGDGGPLALGANIVNMAILPAVSWIAVKKLAPVSDVVSAAIASIVSIPLAALLIVGETALLRDPAQLVGWSDFATRMLGAHLLVGVLEGVVTAAAIVLAGSWGTVAVRRPAFVAVACLGFLIVALGLPVSSSLPDGYEAAAIASGLDWLLAP